MEIPFALGQAAWPADLLMPLSLQRLNHVRNIPFAPLPSPLHLEQFRAFQRVIDLLQILRYRGAMELQRNAATGVLVFRKHNRPDTQALIDEVKTRLALEPQRNRFRITTRTTRRQPDEIVIQTRSVLQIMTFLARRVEIPAEHLEAQYVGAMDPLAEEAIHSAIFPLQVRTRPDRPAAAYVAVRFQGHWFYIEPADRTSRRAFGLLTYLFQLQTPAATTGAPLITVPAGP